MYTSTTRIFGLASGMDIDQIVSDLVSVHRTKVDTLEQRVQELEWKREDYILMNAKLLKLRSVAFDLSLDSSWTQKFSATSSDSNVVSASVVGSAQPTTYEITVTSLATVAHNSSTNALTSDSASEQIDPDLSLWSQKDSFRSSAFFSTQVEGDTFTFSINEVDFTASNTNSLNDIVDMINDSDAGVTAFYDEESDKIAISTNATGDNNPSGNEIRLSGAFLTDVLLLDEANEAGGSNAQLTINGLSTTRSSNTFTINGVEFELKGVSADPVTVTVKRDVDALVDMVKNFVDTYNEVLETLVEEYNEPYYKDYGPLTDEQREQLTETQQEQWEEKARSGMLYHDSLLGDVISDMRMTMSSIVEGTGSSYTSLSSIGITTGLWEEEGQLQLDESKLREAIASDPEGVMKLFNQELGVASEQGIAERLYDTLDHHMDLIADKAGYDAAISDNSFLSQQIRELNERIETEEDRLAALEDRYYRQFTVMEQFISQMNTQSMWLMQQFGGAGMSSG